MRRVNSGSTCAAVLGSCCAERCCAQITPPLCQCRAIYTTPTQSCMLEHSYAHSTTCTIFSMDSNISYTPASSIVARVVADRELVPVCSRRAGEQQWSEAFTDASGHGLRHGQRELLLTKHGNLTKPLVPPSLGKSGGGSKHGGRRRGPVKGGRGRGAAYRTGLERSSRRPAARAARRARASDAPCARDLPSACSLALDRARQVPRGGSTAGRRAPVRAVSAHCHII